jgi:hypothetical protein
MKPDTPQSDRLDMPDNAQAQEKPTNETRRNRYLDRQAEGTDTGAETAEVGDEGGSWGGVEKQ